MLSENTSQNEPTKRRILSIDGGGIRGVFPAAFLADIERDLKHPIGSYFDLITGTSTGGIIAIGLALGYSATELLHLYEKHGPRIFGGDCGPVLGFLSRRIRGVRHFYRRKYNSEALRTALQTVLGDKCLGDAYTRLVIPAWNRAGHSVYIYKTAHHKRLKNDYRCTAVDAALATASAPTYFREHVTDRDVGLIDGGVWANNPIALATVEAVTLLEWPRDSLHILSLGCLTETYTFPSWAGIGTLGLKLVDLLMDGQSHGALGMAKLLTGHEHERTAIYRVDHTVPRNAYKMDDPRAIPDLKSIGHSKARDRYPHLEPIFFDQPAHKFTPVYTLDEVHS